MTADLCLKQFTNERLGNLYEKLLTEKKTQVDFFDENNYFFLIKIDLENPVDGSSEPINRFRTIINVCIQKENEMVSIEDETVSKVKNIIQKYIPKNTESNGFDAIKINNTILKSDNPSDFSMPVYCEVRR